ncbi:MAG TPA: DNA polymerase I [Terriglobia bacterium]|nr:DNA polymerase I [Terriglobia bacterium]
MNRGETLPQAESGKKLFLIDAMSLVFRAFYAPMQFALVSSSGMPTKAVYIFIRTLRKILRERRPEYAAVAFDLSAPTFRDRLFEVYKANRPAFPEDLTVQLPYVRRFCDAMGLPIVEREGFEADDVIGTLAREGSEQGLEVLIVSGDEDLFQLVDHRVKVLKPSRSAKDRDGETLCDSDKVKEIIGVEPSKVVDWLALTGDSSDNIPGARPLPGQEPPVEAGGKKRSYIGPKGATELIRQFGTVEAALENWKEASKQSYREALRDFRKEALLSKDLAAIRTDVPLGVRIEHLERGRLDLERIIELCRELGFQSLLKEFLEEGGKDAVSRMPSVAEELSTVAAVEDWLEKVDRTSKLALAAAIEGDEDFSARLVALGLADGSRRAVIPLGMGAPAEALFAALSAALSDKALPKAIHNSKLLHVLLKKQGRELAGVTDDPLLYSYLLEPLATGHSLADIMLRRKGVKTADSPSEAAACARELTELLAPEAVQKDLKRVYDEIELPLTEVIADLEMAGIRINPKILSVMSQEFQQNLTDLTREIYDLAGQPFDIDSPRQLGEILFDKLKLPGGKRLRKSGQYSTEAAVLETLAEQYDLPRRILHYRTRAKLKSTYVDALPRFINPATFRLHSSFNQAGSRTGRLSSSNPNLQNIPVGDEFGLLIRSAFVAEPGWLLIAADYSQIELRVLAHMSQDPLLIEAFSRDEDIHSRTAQELFGVLPALQTHEHRRLAKAINYGVIYGLSSFGLAHRTGTSRGEAQHYIDEYFRRYRNVDYFLARCVDQARKTGEVRTLFGRLRPIPEINSRDVPSRNRAEREAMNTPLQGTAADLMKLAMVKTHDRLRKERMQTRMILTVHDELVFEAPESEVESAKVIVQSEMEGVYPLRVPLRVGVGVGLNWRDAK